MYRPAKKPDKPVDLYQPSGSKSLVRILFLIIIALTSFIVYQYQQTEQNNILLHSKDEQLADLMVEYEAKKKSLSAQVKEAHDEKEAAEQSRAELEVQLRGAKDKNTAAAGTDTKATPKSADIKDMEASINMVTKQIDHLKKEMQRRSKKEALEKFGPGPHRVKFELDFHPDEIPQGTATTFIIEMAPLDLMPYTVNFFLSQVSLGLFNGCSFHRNAGHVVQGGPTANHLNPGANVRTGFKNADLQSVAFQEYHADFPHVKYTLGYAGRPGGPDFYVSTQDNSRNHGPGGQGSYAVKSEADPCFAKVVEGFEAVDRMHTLKVQPGDYNRLVHYVAIKSATLLPN